MHSNEAIEQRLQDELKKKLISSQNTTKVPTPKEILAKIIYYADRCYGINEHYGEAVVDFSNWKASIKTIFPTRGGAQKLHLELTMLLYKHRTALQKYHNAVDNFNCAHEIYEILVAGGIVEELDRTSSITELAQRNPEDAPNGIVHAHYERLDVNEMVNISYAVFRELLEKAEKEQRKLERKIERSQETMRTRDNRQHQTPGEYSEFLTIHHLFLTTVELFTALNHQLYDNTYH